MLFPDGERRRLPVPSKDGDESLRITDDMDVWDKEWTAELIEPLEEKLGVSVTGFDPTISFIDPNHPHRRQVTLPVWLVRSILSL